MEMMTHTIDASKKRLGRIATDAASALAGKMSVRYRKGATPSVRVVIKNAAKMNLPTKKREQKMYRHYTYHPGGLKERTMQQVIDRKGRTEILRLAVYGMLPRTKQRPKMMKLLTIEE